MNQDLSKAEVQLCIAAKNIRKPSFTKDDLRGLGEIAFKEELEDWGAEIESFCQRDLFRCEKEDK